MKVLHLLNRLTVQTRVLSTNAIQVRCWQCNRLQTKFIPSLILHQNNHYGTVTNLSGTPSGLWKNIKWKLGIKEKMRYPKLRLKLSSQTLYVCITELVDHNEFIKELELPDTFHSWFQIVDLHVWLVMVKLAQMDQEGRFIRNELVRAMWLDVEKRSHVILEGQYYSGRTKFIQALNSEFKTSLFSYDEGLLSDDRVLACAVWRVLFSMNDVKPEKIALMVEYIRKQVQFLDKLDSERILKHGTICFLPLHGDEENKLRNKQILERIMRDNA